MLSYEMKNVLGQHPLGLVFDIDGTLSPIAPTPDEARLYLGVAELLTKVREQAHIAIMTGRAVDDGAALVNVEGLTYIGTHGLEWCDGLPATHTVELLPEALPYVEPGEYLLDLAEQHLANLEGVIVERKRIGGSLHYRLAPRPEETRRRIFALLEEPARQVHMRLGEGKRVVEILSPLAVNKGYALRRFAHMHALRGLLFAGDDRTDLDAVREIPRLRQEGVMALAIVVRQEDTLPNLLAAADVLVEGVPGMAQLLQEIVDQIGTRSDK